MSLAPISPLHTFHFPDAGHLKHITLCHVTHTHNTHIEESWAENKVKQQMVAGLLLVKYENRALWLYLQIVDRILGNNTNLLKIEIYYFTSSLEIRWMALASPTYFLTIQYWINSLWK